MNRDLAEAVRAAVQAILDHHGDGWSVAQYVICMGLERVTSDGSIEAIPWMWAPPDQADWMTGGLIESAMDLRGCFEED